MDESLRALEAAAHDLRQPLQVIAMTLAAVEHNDSEKYAKALARARRAVASLDHSIEQCIEALQLSSGSWRPDLRTFDLGPFAKVLADKHAPAAAAAGLELRFVFPGAKLRSDPDMLGRLLGNLILNAIAFTPRGGILAGARRRAGGVLIQVFDTGHGSPRQQLGLGFQVAQRFALALGSGLVARSIPGRGSGCGVLIR